jgi:hypothetical protein
LAVVGAVIVVSALIVATVVLTPGAEPSAATRATDGDSTTDGTEATRAQQGFIYGRVTTNADETYEGRLRWGGDQEAFWGDYFNGTKAENVWAAHAPVEQRTRDRRRIEVFGLQIGGPNPTVSLRRLFLARFGDIARIDRHFKDVDVTLKGGTVVRLDRFAAGDIDDGVRVWDRRRGMIDIGDGDIRSIEFLPTPPDVAGPERLYGTVRTQHASFSGFIEWDQQDRFATDTLDGRADGSEISVRYDTIRSIARYSRDAATVTLRDGREMRLSDARDVGRNFEGVYVDDSRYGRVLISWEAFVRADFGKGGRGPEYGDFPPGRPLAGSVTTRDGRRLTGRLVYDFDESRTNDTFDSSFEGIDYNIPLDRIVAIVPAGHATGDVQHVSVTLQNGEELSFERSGDAGDGNAGILIFSDGRDRPAYVPWRDVERIDFESSNPSQSGGGH